MPNPRFLLMLTIVSLLCVPTARASDERTAFVSDALHLFAQLDNADQLAIPDKIPGGGKGPWDDLKPLLGGYEKALKQMDRASDTVSSYISSSNSIIDKTAKSLSDLTEGVKGSYEVDLKVLRAMVQITPEHHPDNYEDMFKKSWASSTMKRGLEMKTVFGLTTACLRVLDNDQPNGPLLISVKDRQRLVKEIDKYWPNAQNFNLLEKNEEHEQVNLSHLSFAEVIGSTLRPALLRSN